MKNDKVVERLTQALQEGPTTSGVPSENYDADIAKDYARRIAQHRAKTALAAIEEGDSLPNGLWAAPEEPTEAMMRAGVRDPDWIEDPRIAAEVTKAYKAMRRAAGGGDD